MEAEVSQQLGAEKSERAGSRSGYRCGYRPRRLETRMGTMYLMVPKVRQGGYISFFVTERKRSEAALIQVVQEAFVQGVSTRKMEKLARRLGIENLSRSQVSEMTKGLNEQAFHSRPLSQSLYPVLWVDAVISDAHSGLVAAIAKAFPAQAGNGARYTLCATSWRMCWRLPESRLAARRKRYVGCMNVAFPRLFAAWKMAWKTRWRSMLFLSWMPERSPPPICWSA